MDDPRARLIRKLLIVPYFGPLPTWFNTWDANIHRLRDHGYDVLVKRNLAEFKLRVREVLGVDCPVVEGEGKVHDYRAALGLLYADEAAGYDFWGHTDMDMVYGRVENWVTDEFLDGLDIHSNHVDYISGPWTLYRNTPTVNELFMRYPHWRGVLENYDTTGWVEREFTAFADLAHAEGDLRLRYTMWQTKNLDNFDRLRLDGDGALWEGNTEVMCAHFRRTKVYPAGCQ